jgi:nucleoside-diphosphate-sugar epimerase
MFGDGHNMKSMAYVENVAAFIEFSFSFESGLHIFNYVDKPDFDMNTLIKTARRVLFGKSNVGIRLPKSIGIGIGYLADGIAKTISKSLPVSSIRVKKFLGTTQFSSSISETGFSPPTSLQEGLKRTLRYEFLEDNSNQPIFETE